MTTQVQVQQALNGTEQVSASTNAPVVATTGTSPLQMTNYNVNKSYTPSSNPPTDVPPVDLSTEIAGGSVTVDLTTAPLARDRTTTQDLTGRFMLAMQIVARSTNTGPVTIDGTLANGFPEVGKITLRPGRVVTLHEQVTTGATPVGAAAKELVITGANTDKVDIVAWFTSGTT